VVDVYAASDGHARFVSDFVKAWDKVMMLDRYDIKGHSRYAPMREATTP
jgi:catalase-peroxidase